jgi:hypothetical protein
MGFVFLAHRSPSSSRAGKREILRFSNKSKQFSKAGQPVSRYTRLLSLLTICTTEPAKSLAAQRPKGNAAVAPSP